MSAVRTDAWVEWVDDECQRIRAAGQWREIRTIDGARQHGAAIAAECAGKYVDGTTDMELFSYEPL